jgi:hypothetical protein
MRLSQPTAQPTETSNRGETSTLKLAVPIVLFPWNPPRIIVITGDSMHPNAQDPYAQVGPDTWTVEIWNYLKDKILPDEHVSVEWIAHVAK